MTAVAPDAALRPRHLAFRGQVYADAVLFDRAALGEEEARRRVLALWRPGCRLFALDGAWLLRLPAPVGLRAPFPGRPLFDHDGVLVGVPLDPRERAALPAASLAGRVLLPADGVLRPHTLGEELHPSDWLALGGLTLVEPVLLGPAVVHTRSGVSPREVPSRSEGEAAGRRAVQQAAARAAEIPTRLEEQLPVWARWLARSLAWVDRRLEALQPAPPKRPLVPGVPRAPRPPTWIDRLRGRLSGWILALATRGPLSWMARREAAWLRELLDAFDRGDLDEALRRAVPLGSLDEVAATATRPPGRRLGDLVPTPRLPGSAASMLLSGPGLHETLRALYEQSVERLVEEDRIDEAAFVLADLLDRPADAVDLLHAHARYEAAAVLAEGRELDPVWVVCLWVEAEELERAVALGRRHGVLAEAVDRVSDELAWAEAGLRRAWAQTREAAGDRAGAIGVLAAHRELVEEARALAADSLDRPGVEGLRVSMMAWELLGPDAVLGRIRAVLGAPGPAGRRQRGVLLDAARHTEGLDGRGSEARPADRRLARRLLRVALAEGHGDRAAIDRLARVAGSAALREDLPRDAADDGFGEARTRWEATDRGDLAVHDAAWLADGRVVVALGAAGVRVLSPEGRVLGRVRGPHAEQLVVPRSGSRLIVVGPGPRGTREIWRLDLAQATAERWARAELVDVSTATDGERWCVSTGRELLVVDLLAEAWTHLWRVPVDGRLTAVHAVPGREEGRLRGVVWQGGEAELWRWDLPSLTLRARLPLGASAESPRLLGPTAVVCEGPAVRIVGLHPDTVRTDVRGVILGGRLEGGRSLLVERLPDDAGVCVWHRVGVEETRLHLEGATWARVRQDDEVWVVSDDTGRVIGVDREGRIALDLRVRV